MRAVHISVKAACSGGDSLGEGTLIFHRVLCRMLCLSVSLSSWTRVMVIQQEKNVDSAKLSISVILK